MVLRPNARIFVVFLALDCDCLGVFWAIAAAVVGAI